MSWDIFPKDKIEYTLLKLKDIFDSKVDTENGKGLSTNDYTNADKTAVSSLGSAAFKNTSDFATSKELRNTDLNTVKTVGFYNAPGQHGNTNCMNLSSFGLAVIHDAAGDYYTQIMYGSGVQPNYYRKSNNGTWGEWSEIKYTDTTYTFANGTNGFTVTPAGGTAQTVQVTPNIANNITGSGTSGYLAKFNGTNTITNGPQLGSSTSTYLRNNGTWGTPSNTYDRNRYNVAIKAGDTITSGNIIVGKNGEFVQLNTGAPFDITYPILYANANIESGATSSNNYDVLAIAIATTQNITLTDKLPVFIKGTLNGNIFTPIDTAPLTQTIPTTDDDKYYILLGIAYSTTNLYLNIDHRIFAFKDGKFREIALYTEVADTAINLGSSTVGNTNKPIYLNGGVPTEINYTLGTAAEKDVAASGNASTIQVVMGNDTRLTDSRPASDVYSWAKASVKPSYTKSEVGLGNVGNFLAVSTVASQGLTTTQQANARANIGAGTSSLTLGTGSGNAYYGDKGKTAYDHSQSTHARTDATAVAASTTNGNIKINGTETTVYIHPGSGTNPHGTTKSDVGLGNVDNTSDATKKTNFTGSIASGNTGFVTGGVAYTALAGKLDTSLKGAASGLAELDSSGKVPSSQLPSYVDDVLEYNSQSAFPATGETGKIYVAKDTNKTYRWSGTAYVEISPSLALGETSSTAYYGDKGKAAYEHATDSDKLATATASGLYKVASTAEGHIASLTAVTKADITGLGIPGSDTNTHRPIQVNGTEVLGNNTTALNLKEGNNVSITNSSGTVTIAATDTNNRKSFYGTCSTAADTAAKVVTLANSDGWELKAGTVVGVKFSASNTASSVTLNVNGSGAKSIYYSNAVYTSTSTAVTGIANTIIYYMYDGTYWVWMGASRYWNDNTYDRNRFNANIKCDTTAIVAGNIIVGKNGVYHHLKDGSTFDITYPILYAASNIAASATGNNNYDIINFTVTTTQSVTLTAYKPVYIKGTLSGVIFTPDSTAPLVQTVPTTVDNKCYMLLGVATSTTAVYLQERHPIYKYTDDGNGFIEVSANYGAVLQQLSSVNAWRKVLLTEYNGSEDATASPSTAGARTLYTNAIQVNPSSSTLKTPNLKVTNINGVAVGSSPKFTDTTYTLTQDSSDGHKITFAGSDSSSTTITIPDNNTWRGIQDNLTSDSATDSLSAKQGKALANGSARDSTKVAKSGDTMTGNLTIEKDTPLLLLKNTSSVATGTNVSLIRATYKNADGSLGLTVDPISIIGTNTGDGYNVPVRLGSNNGTTIVSAGESGPNFASKQSKYNDEALYLVSDSDIKLYKNMTNEGALGYGPYEAAGFTGTITDGRVVVSSGTRGGLATSAYTIAKSVPADAVFTDHYAWGDITSKPTTISGYGITDAKIASGTITLGSNSITPLTSASTLDATKLSGTIPSGCYTDTKNTAGSTDTSSKIFLVGATSQAANPQTYSDDQVYTTSGTLTSNKISTKAVIALTGSGTAGQDKGSGVSPRYIPALWTFNSGVTVANGEVYFIKIPVAGGTWGVWLSLNNGTNYYPVAVSTGKARFTTHYGANTVIAVTYESAGVCTCYAKAGADSTSDVTGIFRVLNDYDANTTYSAMSSSELTTGTATSSRVVRADYLKTGINSLIDTKIGALDVTGASGIAASKTISAWSETDGKVSVTTQDISITKSQVSDFPTSMTPTSHTHGNIQNGGTLQTNDITIASGDKLVVTDSSDSSKIARTSVSFDGSTTTKALTQKGTFETFAKTDTDRYVNSAAFADDTTNNANSPVKMTLTRAGSDTVTVTANIPKVSSSGAGVVPKGAAVSSQSQSTKFLREDGTWAAPSYTTDTNTHRPIQMNGTEILGNNTTALNLKAGSNVTLTNSSGTVTIAATDTNTWRGIQDNLTSDSTTDSLSAKQGKNLANGSARDSTKLPLAGGTMTGRLTTTKPINDIVTGSGTTAQDKGSGVSPRYFPAKWTYNTGQAVTNGDIIVVKLPCAGHDYGVFISIDNGTTYKPVAVGMTGTSRLTTHFGSGAYVAFIYDSSGTVNNVYAAAGADARTNVSGGCWRVFNYYDTGNTYDRNRYNVAIKAWGTKIIAGNIIVAKNGVYHHLKEGTAFDINYPILYLNGDCNANSTTTNTYDCIPFTVTTTQSITLTAYQPVYIKGTLSGKVFTPISTTPLVQTEPTTPDNYYYYYLGMAYSTTAIYLETRHPIYTFINGEFQEIVGPSAYRKNYIASFSGNGDSASYCKVCTLTIKSSYVNGPIEIKLQERGRSTVTRLYILFSSVNNTDPALSSFKVLGGYTGYYIYKSATSTWEIYATKNEAWSGIWVLDCSLYNVITPGVSVVWNMVNASLPESGYTQASHLYATSDTNTHRPIQVNGTEILGNNTTALNLKAGSNVSLTNSSGTVTIAATDTNTHRPIQVNGTEILGNNTTVLNLKAGSNVSLTNSSGTVTIAATDTNTWRPVQNNLTSDSTSDCLSAAQGKALANGSARDNTKLSLSGGTMTGQLKTSFNSAVATGSYQASATTIPNLCTELRYSSGVMGSVSITTAYTKNGVTIPTGWYNFIWVPHRSGGANGTASGDNCDYGALYLTAMTMESNFYYIRFSSGSITEVRNVLDADTGRYVCTDSVISYSPINKTVTRVGGTAGWNSHIYSKNGYKDSVYVSFKASQANKALMVGLNSDPTTDTNYTSLDYAWYLESNGTKTIYESGSKIASYGTYSANDEFRIEVHGGHIYYFYISSASQSGPQIQLIRVTGNSISKIFYLDSSFYDLSGSIYNLEFGNSIGIASKIQVEKEDGSTMGSTYLSVPFINQETNDDLSTIQTLKHSNYFRYAPALHSIVCGEDSSATGYEAFALGYKVQANANSTLATGEGTIAGGEYQTVIGKYNVSDTTSAFIIGNGTSSTRSNALSIDFNGNFYTDKLMKVYKQTSVSTSTAGTWTAMCRSDQAGSPTCPTNPKWWNIISLGNWNNDSGANWTSQLAIATQDDPSQGVWWRCNDSGGTNINNSTWRRLADGQNDGVANIGNGLNFGLALTNNNKWYKLISMPYTGTNSNESFDMIISVSVNTYSYSNGTSATFLLHSHYGTFTLTPITATGEYCPWITNWRVTHDSNHKFVEFKVTLPSGATEAFYNGFRINCINLSRPSYTNKQYTVYETLSAAASGTTVDKTYSINSTFRTLTVSEALETGSATWTRTASTAGSVTLRKYGKVKELVMWGTTLPAVSGAAVSTLQLSDSSYYPHNNINFIGSDDNGQMVIGYITSGGTVYLANRSAVPIYFNVTYM